MSERRMPDWPFVVNHEHPLAEQLIALFVCPYPGARVINLLSPQFTPEVVSDVDQALRSAAAPTGHVMTEFGYATRDWSFSADDTSRLNITSGSWSVGGYVRVAGYTQANQADFMSRYSYTSESNNDGWMIGGRDTGKWRFIIFNNNGQANYNACLSTTSRANGDWVIGGTTDGTTRRIWVNGVNETSTGVNPNASSQTTNGVVNTSAATETQSLYIGAFWGRELFSQDWLAWNRDPWCLVRPVRVRRWFPVGVVAAPADGVAPFVSRRESIMHGRHALLGGRDNSLIGR